MAGLVFVMVLICLVSFNFVSAAWNEPTEAPPGGNVSPPLNQDTDFSGDNLTGKYNSLTLKSCPTSNQVLKWDGSQWACADLGVTAPNLLNVLTAGSDAKSFGGQVYMGDGTHATNVYIDGGELRAKWLHAGATSGVNTFASQVAINANNSRQLSSNGWADFSANSSGFGLLGGNAYVTNDGTNNHFKYANTHATIGAMGVAVNYPTWNQVSIISSGTIGSTQGADFVPTTVASFNYNGNVAIGASPTGYKFYVNGDSVVHNGTNNDIVFAANNPAFIGTFGPSVNAGGLRYDGSAAVRLNLDAAQNLNVNYNTRNIAGGSTNLNFTTNAGTVNVMTLKGGATNPGFVGIGTNAPTQKLSVNGSILSKLTSGSILYWRNNETLNDASPHYGIGISSVDLGGGATKAMRISDYYGLLFATGGTDSMSVSQNGRVGIGTSAANANLKLDVEGYVGAVKYCDNNGANCKAITELGGGTGSQDLLSVLTVGADASTFAGDTVKIGGAGTDVYMGRDSNAGRNANAVGNVNAGGNVNAVGNINATGEVRSSWVHATAEGDNSIAGNLGVDGNLRLDGNLGVGGGGWVSSGLKVGVAGNVGAFKYCDYNGNDCKTIQELSASANPDLYDVLSNDADAWTYLGQTKIGGELRLGGAMISSWIHSTSGGVNTIAGNLIIGDALYIGGNHKLGVSGNIGIKSSGYLNFGTNDGVGGYGIRDNGGVIQYKNYTSGVWTDIGSGGSSNPTLSDVLSNNPNASAFTGEVRIGGAGDNANLFIGGEVNSKWIHTTEWGDNSITGNLTVGWDLNTQNLNATNINGMNIGGTNISGVDITASNGIGAAFINTGSMAVSGAMSVAGDLNAGWNLNVDKNIYALNGEVKSSWIHATASGNNSIAGNLSIGGDGTMSPGLKVDVEGNAGATQYCDENGQNCKDMANVATKDSLICVTKELNHPTNNTDLTITCDADYIMTGGGVRFSSDDPDIHLISAPSSDGNGWRCAQRDGDDMICYVRCCKL